MTLLVCSLAFAGQPVKWPGSSAADPEETIKNMVYAEGELLVKFVRGVSFESVNSIAGDNDMQVGKHFKALSEIKGQQFVLLKSSKKAERMKYEMSNHPAVASVSLNYVRKLAGVPNDPLFNELWGMHNTGQTGGTNDADIDAPEAWDVNTGSEDLIVAVIDTGIDYYHGDLAANMWVNIAERDGATGIDDDGNGYVDDIYGIDPAGTYGYTPDTDPMDVYGHGTHCSGTIAAVGDNGIGVAGVNWNARLMALKMFNDYGYSGYDSHAIECIDYVIDQKVNYGQDIVAINASWGGSGYSALLRDAIQAVGNEGILFCAAAGNWGDNNDLWPHYPSSYDLDCIVAVTATTHTDDFSGYNYGEGSVDLAAPGVEILSSVPGEDFIPGPGGLFYDNMESGDSLWVHGGTGDQWGITTDLEGYFWDMGYGNFWSDSPGAGYEHNTDTYLAVAADIDLSPYVGQLVFLGFDGGFQLDYFMSNDTARVEISNDGGATWSDLARLDELYIYYGYYYKKHVYDIPDAYKTSQFRFRFHIVTDDTDYSYFGYKNKGWIIDNVGVGTAFTPNFETWSGTSMATPHVSGAVALLAAQYPDESNAVRKARIMCTTDKLESLKDLCVSEGRLNIGNAMTATSFALVKVSYPTDGESLYVTDFADITWNIEGEEYDNVNLYYSINGGANYKPIATVPNTGEYRWTIPDDLTFAGKIKVETSDGQNFGVSGGLFSIEYFVPVSSYNDVGYAVVQCDDGGYVTAGYTNSYTYGGYDFLVYKLDNKGDMVWRKHFGGIRDDFGHCISKTADGGFILCGYSYSFSHGDCDFLIYKLDADGKKQWRKNFGGAYMDQASSIKQLEDGGYLLVGTTNSFTHGGYDVLIYRLKENGDKMWRKNFGSTGYEAGTSACVTVDGEIILMGESNKITHGGYDLLVYKLDSEGNKIWREPFGGANDERAMNWFPGGCQACPCSDTGYMAVGMGDTYTNGSYDIFLQKIGPEGEDLDHKNFGGEFWEDSYALCHTADGGYLIVGSSDTFTNGCEDFVLYKVNGDGVKLWRKNFGGINCDIGFSVRQTADGGCVLAGTTQSFVNTPGFSDFLLYKLDADGNKMGRKNLGR
jgi:subtilisin family serine protease